MSKLNKTLNSLNISSIKFYVPNILKYIPDTKENNGFFLTNNGKTVVDDDDSS